MKNAEKTMKKCGLTMKNAEKTMKKCCVTIKKWWTNQEHDG